MRVPQTKVCGDQYLAVAAVLAGAYRGGDKRLLVHVAVLDEQGYVRRALCSSVRPDSLTTDSVKPGTRPTCPTCVRRSMKMGFQP